MPLDAYDASIPVLVTGAAGFIGFNLSERLIAEGHEVVGYDCVNDYYDVSLKETRIKRLEATGKFTLLREKLEDADAVNAAFDKYGFELVVNLAAQAGVRYSLDHPQTYIEGNIVGFFNILEACRHHGVKHLLYASSSSVYGLNKNIPFAVEDNVDHPVSLYAASKKSNELMAHAYSHLFGVRTTGLRFFTVYGPWGRPDMALFLFSKAILLDQPMKLFNYGNMRRDFTYIDDIVEGIIQSMRILPAPDPNWTGEHPNPGTSSAPYRLYNIGRGQTVELRHFLELIEKKLGKKAIVEELPMQMGDVAETTADIESLRRDTGYEPKVSVEEGIDRFLDWFMEYYDGGKKLK